jgi:hypothetical protein
MRAVILISFVAMLTAHPAAGRPTHVRLHPGQRITLHVGQVADLELPSGHPYSVDLAGDSVVPMESREPGTKVRSYRAAHPGNATLLIEPADSKPGDCIDCDTRHCFLTVVP